MNFRTRLAAATLLAAAALTSCSTNVDRLQVGQCVNGLEPVAPDGEPDEVGSLPVVDCAEQHIAEIQSLHELPDGDYPGTEAVGATADELCAGQSFTDYVGVAYGDSQIFSSSLIPTEESWAFGDRQVTCLLGTEDDSPTTGSVRGANR